MADMERFYDDLIIINLHQLCFQKIFLIESNFVAFIQQVWRPMFVLFEASYNFSLPSVSRLCTGS